MTTTRVCRLAKATLPALALACGIVAAPGATAASADLLFDGAALVIPGSGPIGSAIADFNGDQFPDVVTAHSSGPDLHVLLGKGNGSLMLHEGAGDLAVPSTTQALVVADFDLDGAMDLATSSGNDVSTLLGDGSGGFTYKGTYGWALGNTYAIAAGEFNNDGRPDLVTAGGVNVFLGHADGEFTYAGNFGVGHSAEFVVVGDFTGDDQQDLATLGAATDTVHLLQGSGDGTFAVTGSWVVGSNPRGLVVADLDADGALDLVAANSGGAGSVSMLFGDGSGGFAVAGPLEVAPSPWDICAADFNGDGAVDLATVGYVWNSFASAKSTVSVLLGDGGGGFMDPDLFEVGFGLSAVASTDFDADGVQDLLLGSPMVVLRGLGDGTFPSSASVAVGKHPVSAVVADFDGDGDQDLATANDNDFTNAVSVLLGDGAGVFAPGGGYSVGGLPAVDITAGDFDGDGDQDLAAPNQQLAGEVGILLGSGDGSFSPGGTVAVGTNPVAIAVGDFDEDGVPDLVTANNVPGTVRLLLGHGDGTFTVAPPFGVGAGPLALVVSDINSDGHADLATAGESGTVSILLGNGNASFTAGKAVVLGALPTCLATADFNADGAPDLAVGLAASTLVLLGQGDGGFTIAGSIALAYTPFCIASGDFDGDGIPDLAAGTGHVDILLGHGDGSFTKHGTFVTNPPLYLAAGDFDGNGALDLASAGGEYTWGRVGILLNLSPGAWTHLATGLNGVAGVPSLLGSGSLQAGSAGELTLKGAAPSAPALLLLSTSSSPVPFKCGTLMPVPPLLALPLATDAAGKLVLGWAVWPAGLSGLHLWWQYAIGDAAAPCGVALSIALKSNVP